MAAFEPHKHSKVAATEAVWPTEPKTYTIWFLTEKVGEPCCGLQA